MPQFHETGYGRKFFEVQLPKLTKAIEKVGEELEKQNEYAEKMMGSMTNSSCDSFSENTSSSEPTLAKNKLNDSVD